MNMAKLKKEAAYAAVAAEVRSGMKLGLGTGSTVAYALDALGEGLREGRIGNIVGVPTSERTAKRARELGIPLIELHEVEALDVTIDGADEIDPNLELIKGLGGALLREKMIAQVTTRFVIIGDERKFVQQLGQKAPLPVEVVQFGWLGHLPFLKSQGAHPVRRESNGVPYVTDNSNYIIDCHFDKQTGIPDPKELDRRLLSRAGIVDHGLFLHMGAIAYVATQNGVITMAREA
ncbi:MAG: ribose 5-phosphate isomerase A [Ardenticatenaceae bacterium]